MNKKAIAILGAIFILIVGTLGFLVYEKYAVKQPVQSQARADASAGSAGLGSQTAGQTASSTQSASGSTPGGQAQQPPATGSLVKLSDSQVLSPALFYNGSGITYFTPAGDLYQADLVASGTQIQLQRERNLNIKEKAGISKVIWPAAGNDFIAEVDAPGSTSWSYFNSQTGDYTDFPPQVESFDWMPQGNKIMYVWYQNGVATLNISNPDLSGWAKVSNMWEPDDSIRISPDGTNILYYETASASTTNPIYMVSQDGKVWKTPVADGYNLGVLWSPDSQKFLFGKRDPATGTVQLWEYDLAMGTEQNLGINTTPDKAVWSKDSSTVYAAVPSVGNAGAGNLTQDAIYRITPGTQAQKQYNNFSDEIDGQSLFLSLDGTKLFFKNGQDGYLYYLDVSK